MGVCELMKSTSCPNAWSIRGALTTLVKRTLVIRNTKSPERRIHMHHPQIFYIHKIKIKNDSNVITKSLHAHQTELSRVPETFGSPVNLGSLLWSIGVNEV